MLHCYWCWFSDVLHVLLPAFPCMFPAGDQVCEEAPLPLCPMRSDQHPPMGSFLTEEEKRKSERETVKTVKKQLNGINFLCSIQSNMKVLLFYKKWWEQICSLRCFSCLSSLVYVQSRREETLNLQCSLLGDYWPFSSLLSLQYRLVWLFYFYPFR